MRNPRSSPSPSEKRIAILQSNYIPWKGYFDLIRSVDVFVVYDEVQYTKNDWRNRNRIKSKNGPLWLTIPIATSGRAFQKIDDAIISDNRWPLKHWKSISQNYVRATHFKTYKEMLEDLYLNTSEKRLSEVNIRFIRSICSLLKIETKITSSADYNLREKGRTERLIELCIKTGGVQYLSGPSAKNYLDEALIENAGLQLRYMDYKNYAQYKQLYPPFEHHVSIIDLILNEGQSALQYMKSAQ